MSNVIACVDGAPPTSTVCDYAIWASQRLTAPLTLLHVLDHGRYPVDTDLSGAIGLGAREQLLEELAALDEKRARLAMEQGRLLLEAASQRVIERSAIAPMLRQRHGSLAATLDEMSEEIRLLVMGLAGDHAVGSHLETVVRTLHRPILVVPTDRAPPTSALIAFDGSPTGRRALERLVDSPLLRGMPLHLLMVGKPSAEHSQQLDWGMELLTRADFTVERAQRDGDVEPTIHAYQAEHALDLLVMGAYGHSRIREFLLGSTTARLLRTTTGPLLILR